MKTALSLLLTLCLCIPSCVLAEATFDISTLSLDELNALQERIAIRIAELIAKNSPETNGKFSGQGTTIQRNVTISDIPVRITSSATEGAEITFANGSYECSLYGKKDAEYIFRPGTYDLLVETKSDWSVSIEPIHEGGAMTIHGVGPFIGDFFDFEDPTIVTIDAANLGTAGSYFGVYLCRQNASPDDRWDYRPVSMKHVNAYSTFQEDVIIKPIDGRHQYSWFVECDPMVAWQITLK